MNTLKNSKPVEHSNSTSNKMISMQIYQKNCISCNTGLLSEDCQKRLNYSDTTVLTMFTGISIRQLQIQAFDGFAYSHTVRTETECFYRLSAETYRDTYRRLAATMQAFDKIAKILTWEVSKDFPCIPCLWKLNTQSCNLTNAVDRRRATTWNSTPQM